jgi:hypothetical protein
MKRGRKKDALNRMLKLLNKKSMVPGDIRTTLKISRATEHRIIKEATERHWIEKDSMGRYRLTLLGKSNIGTAKESPEFLSLEVQSQIIDLLNLRSERPTAKCTIEIENAKKINDLDSQTDAVKRFLTNDGLWLPENNTNLKASLATVADSILDLRAKEMGLFSMLDEEFRNALMPYNIHTFFSGYDAIKRYEDLAKTKFRVSIEFDGKKWVSKQDFEDLKKRIGRSREYFAQNIGVMNERAGFNKAIYNLLSGGDLSVAKLHANHLFNSPEELKEYLINHFKINQIMNPNQLNMILKNSFDTGFFSIQNMPLNYLKVNKDKELQFYSSLTFLGPAVDGPRRQTAVNNQEITTTITADNIISTISEELRYFEKSFIDALAKIMKKFEDAYLNDASHATTTPQLPVFEKSLSELILIFQEVVSAYTYRGMMLWPIKIRDKKILENAHSILFSNIANMRILISQRLDLFYGGTFDKMVENYDIGGIYRTQSLLRHVEVFKNSNMENETNKLINSFWNIHRECCQQAFPEALIYGWEFDYNKDSWERFLKLQRMHPEQTYKKYIEDQFRN